MKNFLKIAKVSFMIMVCALFLGIGIKAEAAPGAVTNLKQEDDSNTSIVVSWTAPQGSVAGYVIEYCENSNFEGNTYHAGGANNSPCQIPNLAAGKSYYVRVSAVDSNGDAGSASNVIEAVTAPDPAKKVSGVKQTDAKANAITLSWDAFDGANMYVIGTVETPNATSYTLSGLKEDTTYGVSVLPARKNSTGTYTAYGYKDSVSSSVVMYTLPGKVTNVKFRYSGKGKKPTATCAAFSWKGSSNAGKVGGYEYTVYGNNGKKLFSGTTPSYSPTITNKNLKNTQFMKIRVRAYIKVNGTKKYGPASTDVWFAKLPAGLKSTQIGKKAEDGVKVSWKKMKGAKNYTVYVSTSPYSGFKKVATTSKTSATIKKCRGSKIMTGVNYYYKVIANKKVGKKTAKSDDTWYGHFIFTYN